MTNSYDPRLRSSSWEKRHLKKHHTVTDVRIVVAGPGQVGKSAMVVRFLTKRFIGDYSDEESVSERLVNMDGVPVSLQVWDTESSSYPREEYLDWADGIMLVFSLTDVHSFRQARAYAKHLLHKHRSSPLSHYQNHKHIPSSKSNKCDPAVVLVGNKSDLSQCRQVTLVQARDLAATMRCPYIEISTSENSHGAYRAFCTLYQNIRLVQQCDEQNNNSKISCLYSKSVIKLSGLKQHLKSLTDFRSRTNTF